LKKKKRHKKRKWKSWVLSLESEVKRFPTQDSRHKTHD
jgi:hypothetical protein